MTAQKLKSAYAALTEIRSRPGMETAPKVQQSTRYAFFPVSMPHIEEANYGNFYYLHLCRLKAIGAFVWHISYELGSADIYTQHKHTNIFGLRSRIQTLTDDGSEKRIAKIKRMMNMIMMNIAPLVAYLGRRRAFKAFYPDIVQEFYLWNLCSPFCLFITDLRKRLSWYSKQDYNEKNRKKIYYEIKHAIYNHMITTYSKLKTRDNYYTAESLFWLAYVDEQRTCNYNPYDKAINKIQREEFARSLVQVPKDCRISPIDFINTTLSLLLNEADLADNFNRDYCRFILNKKVIEYRNNIEELYNQDASDENKMIDYVFDEAEKVLNEYRKNPKTGREETRSIDNR